MTSILRVTLRAFLYKAVTEDLSNIIWWSALLWKFMSAESVASACESVRA